jgi:hypothetical protein
MVTVLVVLGLLLAGLFVGLSLVGKMNLAWAVLVIVVTLLLPYLVNALT